MECGVFGGIAPPRVGLENTDILASRIQMCVSGSSEVNDQKSKSRSKLTVHCRQLYSRVAYMLLFSSNILKI